MSLAVHCDGPSCETWTMLDYAEGLTGWIRVEDGPDFCCSDCLLKFYARFASVEVIR